MTNEEISQFAIKCQEVAKVLSNSVIRETELRKQLSNLEAQEQDLLHDIELNDFSRSEKKSFAEKLHDLRVKRRNVKDELELIEIITKIAKNGTNSKAINEFNNLGIKLLNTLDNFKTRFYMPKARTDLKIIKKQGMNARMDSNGEKVRIV